MGERERLGFFHANIRGYGKRKEKFSPSPVGGKERKNG